MKHTKTSLRSGDWEKHDWNKVSGRFLAIGFQFADDVMNLRVYDLLNLNRIDAGAAEEMILALYRRFNPNSSADYALEQKEIDQFFPFAQWHSSHKDYSKVRVRDLVMAEDINKKAIQHLYNCVLNAFFKSGEYNWREYRFADYWDYLKNKREEKK